MKRQTATTPPLTTQMPYQWLCVWTDASGHRESQTYTRPEMDSMFLVTGDGNAWRSSMREQIIITDRDWNKAGFSAKTYPLGKDGVSVTITGVY